MEDQTPTAYEHERWQVPRRTRVWLSRFVIVCAIGLVLFASPWVYDRQSLSDSARLWQDLLSVAALLCVVPMAAVAWSSVSQPLPHDRTMLVLTRALDPAERRAITRSLRRRGAIHPDHYAYARAWVAQQRRALAYPAVMTAVIWSQALNACGRAIGSGSFWLMTVAAVGITTLSVGALVLQRRREHSVREFGS